jgi:hypothetical protein
MSYLPKTFLRLYDGNTVKASAVITKSGEIFQIKPTRQMFKTLDEWHTDGLSLRVEKPHVIKGEFLIFKKYQDDSDIRIYESKRAEYLRKKALLESYHKDPLKFFQHYYSSKFIFWKFIYTKDFKTVGEAENYLLEKSKKSKLLAYVFNRFMEYIGEIAYTSSSSFTDFRLKIWNDAQNSMQLTATYTELSKYIRLTDPAKLSDKESYVPRFSYSRNFIWKDKKMIPIAVNYEKKSFFMLPNDPKTYSSLAEVGVRVDDLYHKDSFSIIMPS